MRGSPAAICAVKCGCEIHTVNFLESNFSRSPAYSETHEGSGGNSNAILPSGGDAVMQDRPHPETEPEMAPS
jgi:hypothetical protein